MKPFDKTILTQILVCPNMTEERSREIVAALEVIQAVIAEPGGLAMAREEARRMVTRRCPSDFACRNRTERKQPISVHRRSRHASTPSGRWPEDTRKVAR